MRLAILVLAATLCVLAQSDQSTAPVLSYRAVEWPIQAQSVAGFSAGPWNFIQVASVAATAKGNILVLHRGTHPLKEFDAAGKLIRTWGDSVIGEGKVVRVPEINWSPARSRYSAVYGPAGCYACGAHSVRVDPQGNTWVVDATSHVIYKLDASGKVLLQLGTKGTAGTSQTTFNLPTDIGFAPNGDLYVSDGYGNPRVVKFSREGKFLREWGKRGTGPGEFMLPHNVAVDARGRVYVSDRDNNRVQVFDPAGEFLAQWNTGGVSALAITADQKIWTGTVLRDLSGKAIGKLPEGGGHGGLALMRSGDVYLAELSGIVRKFVPVRK